MGERHATTDPRPVTEWAIIHPSGWVEVDYFDCRAWTDKGRRVSRETWRLAYRPDCRMVRATLTWPT